MRKVISVAIVVLAVVALAACGGGGSKNTTTATPSGSNTTGGGDNATGGSGGDGGDFCQTLIAASASLDDLSSDPNGARDALNTFKQVDPPAELAGVWDDYLKALDELSKTSDDDDAARAQIAVRHAQSFAAVGLFIAQSCANAFSGLSDFSDFSDFSS